MCFTSLATGDIELQTLKVVTLKNELYASIKLIVLNLKQPADTCNHDMFWKKRLILNLTKIKSQIFSLFTLEI